MTAHQLSSSAAICLPNACGVLPTASNPTADKRSSVSFSKVVALEMTALSAAVVQGTSPLLCVAVMFKCRSYAFAVEVDPRPNRDDDERTKEYR